MPLTIAIILFPVLIALLVLAGLAAAKDKDLFAQDKEREDKWAAYEHRNRKQ